MDVIARNVTISTNGGPFATIDGEFYVDGEWQTVHYTYLPAALIGTVVDMARNVGAVR